MPADWLTGNATALAALAPGRALDLACGTGRNALALARLGFAVEAVDISDVAIERVTAAARAEGLTVHARRADLEDAASGLPAGAYDVVVIIDYLQRDLCAPAARALRPGGLLLAETFTTDHVDQLGRRFNPRFLLEPGELRAAFPTLEIVREREEVIGDGDSARAVASVLARRPAIASPR